MYDVGCIPCEPDPVLVNALLHGAAKEVDAAAADGDVEEAGRGEGSEEDGPRRLLFHQFKVQIPVEREQGGWRRGRRGRWAIRKSVLG